MVTDNSNNNFKLAADFINYTNRSVFLTGKAGTGKTTFLKYIKQNSNKQMAVVAPTGVAAINAGGVTIHSFFQLPFGPYIPEGTANLFNGVEAVDKHHLLGRLKLTAERRKILQEIELLIIDEISMVRADILDAIDIVLKHFRSRYNEPFGGVQLLLIGDMFQLPPVVKNEDWDILSTLYSSPYFFSSKVIETYPLVYIELTKIYRQKDESFIHILNGVRNNILDDKGYSLLHQQYKPDCIVSSMPDYITLTTHNQKADEINNQAITKINAALHQFKATIKGEFSEKAYPADETLELKVGAQVMFIKNDTDKTKRYFNGKIGTVSSIEEDKIYVICSDDTEAIEVSKYEWENIRYNFNKSSNKVEEEVMGSFIQYPLRLAWAITIHKSQGLTFERAIIDAGKAFASGQVYVALSRCTSLTGMILLSKITSSSLRTDERIIDFSIAQSKVVLPEVLHTDKHIYQSKLILDLFSLSSAATIINESIECINKHLIDFNPEAADSITGIAESFFQLVTVSQKFDTQLQGYLQTEVLPEDNNPLQERIAKATAFYINTIDDLLQQLRKQTVVTDKKELATVYNQLMEQLITFLFSKKIVLQSCAKGFSVEKFQQGRSNITMPDIKVNVYANATQYTHVNSPHPILYKQLKALRDRICDSDNLPIYYVANSKTLEEMSTYLPLDLSSLKKISGFGDAKNKKYGKQFLSIIVSYCLENELESNIAEKEEKKTTKKATVVKKEDTKKQSFELLKTGKSIEAIAKERNLTVGTIEGHLLKFLQNGELKIEELISQTKKEKIQGALVDFQAGDSIIPIKTALGDEVSYGEIRFVVTALGLK